MFEHLFCAARHQQTACIHLLFPYTLYDASKQRRGNSQAKSPALKNKKKKRKKWQQKDSVFAHINEWLRLGLIAATIKSQPVGRQSSLHLTLRGGARESGGETGEKERVLLFIYLFI